MEPPTRGVGLERASRMPETSGRISPVRNEKRPWERMLPKASRVHADRRRSVRLLGGSGGGRLLVSLLRLLALLGLLLGLLGVGLCVGRLVLSASRESNESECGQCSGDRADHSVTPWVSCGQGPASFPTHRASLM